MVTGFVGCVVYDVTNVCFICNATCTEVYMAKPIAMAATSTMCLL